MKDFLSYMVGDFKIIPNENMRSIVVFSIVNACLRFVALYGVVFVVAKAWGAA